MAENTEVTVLLDYYGEMLTPKQRTFLDYYYNDDLSLAEIAENEGITRQGVRDSIKRAENLLSDMENKLGYCRKFGEIMRSVDEISSLADKINEINHNTELSIEINDATARIKSLVLIMKEGL